MDVNIIELHDPGKYLINKFINLKSKKFLNKF
jgi:hypothetical protein